MAMTLDGGSCQPLSFVLGPPVASTGRISAWRRAIGACGGDSPSCVHRSREDVLLRAAYEELENRRKLQDLGEFDRRPGRFRHRRSGIRDVELLLVFHGHSVRQFLS
ncbi:hypothetical protein GUJ93_ZPchr0012g20821 [Zizania palustris]|uniref:Uncharacterized protein n=1 Tax=Zizania palustris TaxID=103762 RepID=A0A8J5WRK4_ZIZPA|nr:hypothetical protein GUJ93_ZPchr0012g20821 [Zizania palustris]